tara:strand:+ start:119673 stop:119870 length:198 start_codon:yes stop_codon:yes gene_type:complete
MSPRHVFSVLVALTSLSLVACTPRVKIEAPDKPIVINLNVKIEHEVRVRVEKDLDNVLANNPGLF